MRVTYRNNTKKKKILKGVKGFFGRRKNYNIAIDAVKRAQKNAYIGRKQLKRNQRRLWIQRINNFLRNFGIKYSSIDFSKISLNRRSISELLSRNINMDVVNTIFPNLQIKESNFVKLEK